MPDYQLGKIYKIVCNITGLIYIGSSCQKYLSKRLAQHKEHYKKYLLDNTHKYLTSYEIIKNDNFNIILVEKYPCNDNIELRQRERYYYDLFECVNKIKPYASEIEQKETEKKYNQNYRDEHKPEINKYKINYRNEHRNEIKKYNDEHKEKYSTKILCNCSKTYTYGHTSRHLKSKKHLKYVSTQI